MEILISIKPQWAERILNGEKTVEVRKTKPICNLPCKVYIYCSKGKAPSYACLSRVGEVKKYEKDGRVTTAKSVYLPSGYIIAEFILSKVDKIEYKGSKYIIDNNESYTNSIAKKSLLEYKDLFNYLADKGGYAWSISDLKIYDKPKELREFSQYIPNNKCLKKELGFDCKNCVAFNKEYKVCMACYYLHKTIKKPPQSWCYCEKLEEKL